MHSMEMVNESRMPTASHAIPFRESSMVDTREQKAPRTLHTHTATCTSCRLHYLAQRSAAHTSIVHVKLNVILRS